MSINTLNTRPLQRRLYLVFVYGVIALACTYATESRAAGATDEESSPLIEIEQAGPGEVFYAHPLAGTAQAGQVPVIDIKNQNGRRLGVLETFTADAGGQTSRSSGVAALTQRTLTPAEREALLAEKATANGGLPPNRDDHRQPKIGAALATKIAGTPAGQRLPVLIRFADPSTEPLIHALQRQIGLGNVRTLAERDQVRGQLLAARQGLLAQARAPIDQAIAATGGQINYRCRNLTFARAGLRNSFLRERQLGDVLASDIQAVSEHVG